MRGTKEGVWQRPRNMLAALAAAGLVSGCVSVADGEKNSQSFGPPRNTCGQTMEEALDPATPRLFEKTIKNKVTWQLLDLFNRAVTSDDPGIGHSHAERAVSTGNDYRMRVVSSVDMPTDDGQEVVRLWVIADGQTFTDNPVLRGTHALDAVAAAVMTPETAKRNSPDTDFLEYRDDFEAFVYADDLGPGSLVIVDNGDVTEGGSVDTGRDEFIYDPSGVMTGVLACQDPKAAKQAQRTAIELAVSATYGVITQTGPIPVSTR